MEHRLPPGAAAMLALAFALVPQGAAAQTSKLEAVYVVLGARGAVARAVLSDMTQCPAIVIDGTRQAMGVRALPDTGPNAFFPVLVCELPLPAGAASIGTTVNYGRADLRFGFTTLEPAAQGGWSATFRDVGGKSYFGCRVTTGQISCN